MFLRKFKGVLGTAALLAAFGTSQLAATPVALELTLLVDTSGSIDADEFTLQRQGYRDAFKSASVQAAIAALAGQGGIAVNYIEWSGSSEFLERIGWTQITTGAQADAFGDAIFALPRIFQGLTAPGNAISYARPRFTGNGFEGARLVIDISGDGVANDGIDTFTQATTTAADGIRINGLAILGAVIGGDAALLAFYQDDIVTPGGGTLFQVNGLADADQFRDALINKIGREITGTTGEPEVPEPGTYVLMSAGVAVLMAAKFRRNS